MNPVPEWMDAFGNQLSRVTKNDADLAAHLAAHYNYNPERYRFSRNGTRELLQYQDISACQDFDDRRSGDEEAAQVAWGAVRDKCSKSGDDDTWTQDPENSGAARSSNAAPTSETADPPMPTDPVLVTNTIDTESVDRRTFQGREHLVAPVTVMRSMDLNLGYVPEEEIVASQRSWSGTPLTLNHPTNEHGALISANNPQAADTTWVGRLFNPESKDSGDRLDGELWVDVERARSIGPAGQDVIDRLESGEPLEVSSAYFFDRLDAGEYDGEHREKVSGNLRPDHLALLPNKQGRCSLAEGCGFNPREGQGQTQGAVAANSLPAPQLSPDGPAVSLASNVTVPESVSTTPPQTARSNAQQALDAADAHGNPNDCGTATGWRRASQLASGEELSYDVLSRMSQFNRHRQHSNWAGDRTDCGWLMWKAWGGSEGVDWAQRKLDEIDRVRGENRSANTSGSQSQQTTAEAATADDPSTGEDGGPNNMTDDALTGNKSVAGVSFSGTKGGKLDESALDADEHDLGDHYLYGEGDSKGDYSYPVVDADGNLRASNVSSAWNLRGHHSDPSDLERKLKSLNSEWSEGDRPIDDDQMSDNAHSPPDTGRLESAFTAALNKVFGPTSETEAATNTESDPSDDSQPDEAASDTAQATPADSDTEDTTSEATANSDDSDPQTTTDDDAETAIETDPDSEAENEGRAEAEAEGEGDEPAESGTGSDTSQDIATMDDQEKVDDLVQNHDLDRENIEPLKGTDCLGDIHSRFAGNDEFGDGGDGGEQTETADADVDTQDRGGNDPDAATETTDDTDAAGVDDVTADEDLRDEIEELREEAITQDNLQEAVSQALAQNEEQQTRQQLVDSITANSDRYSESELEGTSVSVLEKIQADIAASVPGSGAGMGANFEGRPSPGPATNRDDSASEWPSNSASGRSKELNGDADD